MTEAPGTLDQLRAIRDPAKQAQAAKAYIENGEAKLTEARRIRDEAVRALAKSHSKAEVARIAGLSLAMVKIITRP